MNDPRTGTKVTAKKGGLGAVTQTVREALPIATDTIESAIDTIRRDPLIQTPEEVQKVHGRALLALIALAAFASILIHGRPTDAIVLALITVLYAGLTALLIWGTGQIFGFLPQHSASRVLTNVIGSFTVGLTALILAQVTERVLVQQSFYDWLQVERTDWQNPLCQAVACHSLLRLLAAETPPASLFGSDLRDLCNSGHCSVRRFGLADRFELPANIRQPASAPGRRKPC